MKDFIYDSDVRIFYGAGQLENVVQEIKKLGDKLLIVPTGSFLASKHYAKLEQALTNAGLEITCMNTVKQLFLSKVNEGIKLCTENKVNVVLGIGGGVSMDLAKVIAFGVLNTDVLMEKFLTYEVSIEGLSMLPVVTISTNPMSGSETNADVQITLDESCLQVGCGVGKAVFTWLNPNYITSLPAHILAHGQMTTFVQLSINYLNLARSPFTEHYAEVSMTNILECLRRSLADKNGTDALGTLLLNSTLSLSGINDLGREGAEKAISKILHCIHLRRAGNRPIGECKACGDHRFFRANALPHNVAYD